MTPIDAQRRSDGRLQHLLTIRGLDRELIQAIFRLAEQYLSPPGQAACSSELLRGRTITNLFFESSTRTRSAFEIAAKRLGASVSNMDVGSSSTSKGETLLDTLKTLEAMNVDMFIVRHGASGAAEFIARHIRPGVAVLNAGDGSHAHPTQALLDSFTIARHKPDFSQLRVAIVGDILHSRVARSEIRALKMLGVPDIRLVAPRTLMPSGIGELGVQCFHDMDQGIRDVDVLIMLRLQRERMNGHFLPGGGEFFARYGLTSSRLSLAKSDALVMHPGPINRGVEIESAVADGPQSVILEQVNHGVPIRMAVLAMILGEGQP